MFISSFLFVTNVIYFIKVTTPFANICFWRLMALVASPSVVCSAFFLLSLSLPVPFFHRYHSTRLNGSHYFFLFLFPLASHSFILSWIVGRTLNWQWRNVRTKSWFIACIAALHLWTPFIRNWPRKRHLRDNRFHEVNFQKNYDFWFLTNVPIKQQIVS